MHPGYLPRFNIAIAGAAGVWGERCHAPAINELAAAGIPLRVVAIAELSDPLAIAAARGHSQVEQMIAVHRPTFVDARHGISEALAQLDSVHATHHLDLLIVCTDPIAHFTYCSWAARNAVSFLCDKPIVVVENCSSQLAAANEISTRFTILLDLIRGARARNNHFRAATLLRRRNLAPFALAASAIASVYGATRAPVRSLNVAVSGGVHFTSDEYRSSGAHGFLDGCGSLSFSSYHYLDVIAWFLSLAPGAITTLLIECPYVCRVADCLASGASGPLFQLLRVESGHDQALPQNVAAAELDFLIVMHLLDEALKPLGLVTYTFNRTSYTARTIRPSPSVANPGAHLKGGRMSQIVIDLHQGPCQSIRLLKNDVALGQQAIRYERWVHPMLSNPPYEELLFADAYEAETTTPKRLVEEFIKMLAGVVTEAEAISLPVPIESQELTHRLYAACYELLAQEAEDPSRNEGKRSHSRRVAL
ncbi:MAG TPA: Gfo/Idh/MocA family oxidoreductase [Thermoanaerobaculia bacterium]|nr:Gfo/Idh/MocA family oxidoreductase [Thermoanaerobaculia bacterium]